MEPRSATAPGLRPSRTQLHRGHRARGRQFGLPASSSRSRPASSHENRGDMSSGRCRSATNRRSGSATGRLRSTIAFSSENTAAAPPIPSASDETATVVNTGLRRRSRRPNRTSWKTSDEHGTHGGADSATGVPRCLSRNWRANAPDTRPEWSISDRSLSASEPAAPQVSPRRIFDRATELDPDSPRGQSRLSVPELSRSERGGGGGRICSR